MRKEELKAIRSRYILWTVASEYPNLSFLFQMLILSEVVIYFGFPAFISLIVFQFFTMVTKQELKASVAFSSIALFNMMRSPLDRLAEMVTEITSASVSLRRIESFIEEPPTKKYSQSAAASRGSEAPFCLALSNASFVREGQNGVKGFKLKNVTAQFPSGKLTVIVGPTGSGKSSLLLALLGEIAIANGQIYRPDTTSSAAMTQASDSYTGLTETTAYCPQQPWLFNDTVKENILFGSKYVKDRYVRVLTACALFEDIKSLEYGDLTQVGDKGASLSGGQKQRISLARAVYSSAKYLFLDDCLSALDPKTVVWIYEKCITGPLLRDRTCVLVSHNVSVAYKKADSMIVMADGEIKSQGSPQEVMPLIAKEDLLFEDEYVGIEDDSLVDVDALETHTAWDAVLDNSSHDQQNEERHEVGRISFSVYWKYFKCMGNLYYWIIACTAVIMQQAVAFAQNWWIREWADSATSHRDSEIRAEHSSVYYLRIYAVISTIFVLVSFLRESIFFYGSICASNKIFTELIDRVINATPSFFDATPLGRIINRFSRDIGAIDQLVAPDFLSVVHLVASLLVTILFVSYVLPPFAFVGLFVVVVFLAINALYLNASRELKRMQSITESPLYQLFEETLEGLASIRAYGHESNFMAKSLRLIDTNLRPYGVLWACNRWMSLRAEIASALVSTGAAFFVVLRMHSLDAGMAGLILTNAVSFAETVLWLTVMYAVNEMNFNSVERVQEYLNVRQESCTSESELTPPAGWPQEGAISVENLSLRYGSSSPCVINNLSFYVKPGWKVGIVGRTGAGKSTIASAFFRFLEAHKGKIMVDGVDISTIKLSHLRSALSIIPQGTFSCEKLCDYPLTNY